jgi:hypothetical protein
MHLPQIIVGIWVGAIAYRHVGKSVRLSGGDPALFAVFLGVDAVYVGSIIGVLSWGGFW